jgi:hypothetical protein
VPSPIACAQPHESTSEPTPCVSREKICSLVIPGAAIATPWAVHRRPIDRGDVHSRQVTIHPRPYQNEPPAIIPTWPRSPTHGTKLVGAAAAVCGTLGVAIA